MIVLDASVVVELLTNAAFAEQFHRELALRGETLAVPHLVDLEVASALRKLSLRGRLDPGRVSEFLENLAILPAKRHPHTALLGRIWELRNNFTAYDASYIALAEAHGATLYTSDAKLRTGHRAKVVYLGSWIM